MSENASHLFVALRAADASFNDINYHPIKPLMSHKQYPNKEATWRRGTSRAIIAAITCGSYTEMSIFIASGESSWVCECERANVWSNIWHPGRNDEHLHSTGYFLGETTVPYGSFRRWCCRPDEFSVPHGGHLWNVSDVGCRSDLNRRMLSRRGEDLERQYKAPNIHRFRRLISKNIAALWSLKAAS